MQSTAPRLALLTGADVDLGGLSSPEPRRRGREAEARYAAIVEQAAVGIATVGVDGRWLQVNERLCQMTGFSADELTMMTFQEITHPDDLPACLDLLERMLRHEVTTHTMEKRYLRRDGRVLWARMTVSFVRDESGVAPYVVAVIEDISETQRLRAVMEQSQKLEALGRLVGGLAHEFNNALSSISANQFLARMHRDQADEFLERAEAQVQGAADMVRTLLAYARNTPSAKRRLDLAALVRTLFEGNRALVPEPVALRLEIAPGALPIWGNATQLQQIVMNLVNNALDALELERSPALTVRLRLPRPETLRLAVRPPSGVELVELSVEDNGHGIDDADLEKIFEPFYTTKDHGKGSGLGLAIVSSIVQQHGGVIEAGHAALGGARFSVYLPMTAEPAEPQADEAHARQREEALMMGAGQTILVVDDNQNVLASICDVMKTLGYTPVSACDGVEAVEQFRAHPEIACVLTDQLMPRMGGVELCNVLKTLNPLVPVVLVTGRNAKAEELPAGVVTLVKPVPLSELSVMIGSLVASTA